MRDLMKVSHGEIKAKLDAEKAVKGRKSKSEKIVKVPPGKPMINTDSPYASAKYKYRSKISRLSPYQKLQRPSYALPTLSEFLTVVLLSKRG